MDVVGLSYQGWPGYGRGNGMMSGYGSSPPGYQVNHWFTSGPHADQPAVMTDVTVCADAVRAVWTQPSLQQRQPHAAAGRLWACGVRIHGPPGGPQRVRTGSQLHHGDACITAQ